MRAASAALLVALVVGSCGGRGGRSAIENRQSNARLACAPLAPGGSSCLDKPDPTTTTVSASQPEVTTPPASAASQSTTVPPSIKPLHLEGSDGSLHVTADLETAAPSAGQVVRLNVKIVDQPWVETVNVRFGDRWGGIAGRPAVDCVYEERPTTSSPPEVQESTKTYDHAYRVAGEYRIWLQVMRTSCDDHHRVELTGRVVVGPGITFSNGPQPPEVLMWQSQVSPGLGWVELNVDARDPDGFVSSVVVEWGDGTTETKQYPLTDCTDDDTYWQPTSAAVTWQHAYGHRGPRPIEVIVTSSGCGGADVQTATTTVMVEPAA